MEELQNNNKKIAKNTIIVYIELFTTIIINLVISRLVLQALGASDFGLYNVVGGVVAMFTFVSSSMATTTIRFLNFEMGKKGDVNRIFNQSLFLHIIFSIVILLFLESLGVFYINNYLNVDYGKETDAMFVFQVSTIVACLGIISVPFQSLFVAFEQFSTIAIVNVINAFVKLLMVLALLLYEGNALRFYAVGMSVITFLSFLFYYYLSVRKWPKIVKWKIVRKWKSYKDQLYYSNWNLLSTASLVGRNQGSAILINLFFGTTVNAAYAISVTILHQVNNFIGKFDTAVAPQITQNLGSGNFDRSTYLTSHTCRVCILLMEILFFPLYIELDFLLHLWLGNNVPEGTLVFSQYTLIIAVVSSTSGGLVQLINGTGKIKWFKIQSFLWYISPLIVCYVLFTMGYPPFIIVLLFVLADVFNRATQLFLLHRMFSFDIRKFVSEAYSRPGLVFLIMMLYMWLYGHISKPISIHHLAGMAATAILVLFLCIVVGLYRTERIKIIQLIRNKWIR